MSSNHTSGAAPRVSVGNGVWKRKTKAGQTRYEIGYRDSDGKFRRQVVGDNLTAARRELRAVKHRMDTGERVAPRPKLTFGEAAERWQESIKSQGLRPATIRTYEGHLKTHLLPRWGKRRLDALGHDEAARLIEELRRAGKAAWTIRGVLVVAGGVFVFASDRLGWGGQNPVRLLRRRERPRSNARERRVLDRDELDRLVAATAERDRLVFSFAAGTGCRLGEVLGLRWGKLDLATGTAEITHQVTKTGEYADLKTARSRRVIELPSELTAALREHKLASRYSDNEDYVFARRARRPGDARDHRHTTSAALSGPRDHRHMSTALTRAREGAGLDGENPPTFHSFRHGFASAWIANGGDVVELSAHLGHANPQITLSTYSHEFEKAKRSDERRARIDAIYGSTMAAADGSKAPEGGNAGPTEIADLQAKRDAAQQAAGAEGG